MGATSTIIDEELRNVQRGMVFFTFIISVVATGVVLVRLIKNRIDKHHG